MNFDIDRLARLAGISSEGRRNLNEASNRSFHDDKSVGDEVAHRFGKNQLSEMDHLASELDELSGEVLDADEDAGMDLANEDDIVLEIDEGMLRNEIRKMRHSRLQENKLRSAIRNEIQDIFEDLGVDYNSSWVYGKNKPTNSRDGFVNIAFPGIGFR